MQCFFFATNFNFLYKIFLPCFYLQLLNFNFFANQLFKFFFLVPWISICFATSFLSIKNFNFYILFKWASLEILLYMYGFLAWNLLWGKFEGFFFIYVLDMTVMYIFALWSSLNEMSFVLVQVFALQSVLKLFFSLVVLIVNFVDATKLFIVIYL
jgi:hypothetical protein